MKLNAAFFRHTALPQQAQAVWEQLEPVLRPVWPSVATAKQRAFLRVLGNSNFLARWARRHPESIPRLLKEDWTRAHDLPKFRRELASFMRKIPLGEDSSVVQQKLLFFKYRNFFRITARDMGLSIPFPVIAAEISCLAQAVLDWVYRWERKRLSQDWPEPLRKNAPNHPMPFALLALGKLGGQELNYSSDVDLIYLYESDEAKRPTRKNPLHASPHEFFCKLGERMGRMLGQKTPGGFLYRVDLELRPEGQGGPLANSLDAMEYYYENFGAFWEKQAMIKVGLGAGSERLFQDFYRMIHPFVYPKTTDYSLLEKIQEMKEKVLLTVKKSSERGFHVKLGSGGIREIEFFVQSLQILFGGQKPQLQISNTLSAIEKITRAKIISRSVARGLRDAYLFLRTLENRLQQVEEQQTHRVPEAPEEGLQTARRMGYLQADPGLASENFERDLSRHCLFVQNTFASLLAQKFGDLRK